MAAPQIATAESIMAQAPKELAWAGTLLKLDLNSLDQLASGAVYCQLLDVIYNGIVPMQKVNWTSDKASDFVGNFQLLKEMFSKFGVSREVNVERLTNGDRADLFSLLQWIHIFSYSTRNLGKGYDPEGRRFGKEPNFQFAEKIRSKNQETDSLLFQTSASMKVEQVALGNKENHLNMAAGQTGSGFTNMGLFGAPSAAGFRVANLETKTLQKLAQFDLMQSEREFYFNKLKEIDHVLDSFKNGTVEGLIQTIRDIIYLPQEKVGIVTEEGRFEVLASANSPLLGEEEANGRQEMESERLLQTPATGERFDRVQNISANFGGSGGGGGKPRGSGFPSEEDEGMEGLNLLEDRMDLETS